MGPDQLPLLNRGDRLSAANWNGAVRALRELASPSNQQANDKRQDIVLVRTDDEVPPYSLFSVSHREADEKSDGPVQFFVEKILGDGNPMALYTNGSLTIPEGCAGSAWRVGSRGPARIECTGSPPHAGDPCGPQLNEWGVTDDRYGLVCVGLDDSGGTTFAWVVPADCGNVLVKLTGDLDAYDSDTDTLDSGTAKVLYRDDSDVTHILKDPASESGDDDWEVTVYNAGSKLKTGKIVAAAACVGVGLVVGGFGEPKHKARYIEGTLAGDISGGAASVNATYFADGDDPGGTVSATFNGVFTGNSGDRCGCYHKPEDDTYRGVWVECATP